MPILLDLPVEVFEHVCNYVNRPQSLLNLSRCCKYTYQITRRSLFRKIVLQQFPCLPSPYTGSAFRAEFGYRPTAWKGLSRLLSSILNDGASKYCVRDLALEFFDREMVGLDVHHIDDAIYDVEEAIYPFLVSHHTSRSGPPEPTLHSFKDALLGFLIEHLSKLEVLRVYIPFAFDDMIFTQDDHLTHRALSHVVYSNGIKRHDIGLPNLRRLDLAVAQTPTGTHKPEFVDLGGWRHVGIPDLYQVLQYLPKLQMLNIGSAGVYDDGLMPVSMLSTSKCLRSIQIRDCDMHDYMASFNSIQKLAINLESLVLSFRGRMTFLEEDLDVPHPARWSSYESMLWNTLGWQHSKTLKALHLEWDISWMDTHYDSETEDFYSYLSSDPFKKFTSFISLTRLHVSAFLLSELLDATDPPNYIWGDLPPNLQELVILRTETLPDMSLVNLSAIQNCVSTLLNYCPKSMRVFAMEILVLKYGWPRDAKDRKHEPELPTMISSYKHTEILITQLTQYVHHPANHYDWQRHDVHYDLWGYSNDHLKCHWREVIDLPDFRDE